MKKIERGNLSMQAYERIRGALMDGDYQPGRRLRIAQLADELEVSITPVREALFRLISEQALEMKAATAVHVPLLSPETLTEIQLIRKHLEGACAARAAEIATAAEVAELERIHGAFAEAIRDDPRGASRENRSFHFALMRAGRMPFVFTTASNLWTLMGPMIPIMHEATPRRDLTGDNHKHVEVLRCLRARDADATRAAIQADIAWGDVMIDWLRARREEPDRRSAV